MNQRTDYLTCVLCFVAGGLAGAGGALLFAPQSGHATRGSVARGLRRGARSARDLGERAVRRADRLRGEAARKVEEATAVLAGNGGDQAVPPGTPVHSS